MKLLIILPAKIQAEMPFQQRCKEQVVKYSPKMVWKVHANWFVAKVFSLKTSRTLVLQTCINGKETGIPATTTEEQHYYRLQAKSLPDSCSVDWSINMRQSWMKSVQNFALSYPQNAYPVDLVPRWRLPSHHPGQCMLFRRAQKWSSNVFLEGEGSICSCQCFHELYLQTRQSNVHFSQYFFSKIKHRTRSLARTPVWLSRQRRNSRYDICGWSWINQHQHHNLSTTLVDLAKAFYTFSPDGYAKLCQSLDVPHFQHHC